MTTARPSRIEFAITLPGKVGDLAIGMARDSVRTSVGARYVALRATKYGDALDHFEDLGVMAFYADGEHLSELEFSEPAAPELLRIRPIGMHIDEALRQLAAAGIEPWSTRVHTDDLMRVGARSATGGAAGRRAGSARAG